MINLLQLILIVILGIIGGEFLNVCIEASLKKIYDRETLESVQGQSHQGQSENPWGQQDTEVDIKGKKQWLYRANFLFVASRIKNHITDCLTSMIRKEKKTKIHFLIDLLNLGAYLWIIANKGINQISILECLAASALIGIGVIDEKTFEIPVGWNYYLGVLGVINALFCFESWRLYIFGAIGVSGFLLLIFCITRGQGIGGGDIKLMAATGLLLGMIDNVIGFLIGCILGAGLHILRMIFTGKGRQLAFGPYLCAGVFLAMIYGEKILDWYIGILN